ncbi:hypothetical protein AB0D66_33390 [Streptomyces sp. NPDC048270]|uniref:hypothetical protein n=1 Tax=Streptomyces sp. NPDC048270 TaxID=3154615 RepID=UPI0033D6B217
MHEPVLENLLSTLVDSALIFCRMGDQQATYRRVVETEYYPQQVGVDNVEAFAHAIYEGNREALCFMLAQSAVAQWIEAGEGQAAENLGRGLQSLHVNCSTQFALYEFNQRLCMSLHTNQNQIYSRNLAVTFGDITKLPHGYNPAPDHLPFLGNGLHGTYVVTCEPGYDEVIRKFISYSSKKDVQFANR